MQVSKSHAAAANMSQPCFQKTNANWLPRFVLCPGMSTTRAVVRVARPVIRGVILVIFRIATTTVHRIITVAIGVIEPWVVGIAAGNPAIAIGMRRNMRGIVTRIFVVWIVVGIIHGSVVVRIVVGVIHRSVAVWIVRIIHRRIAVRVVVLRIRRRVIVLTITIRIGVWTIVCIIRVLTVGVAGIFWSPGIVSLWAL